MSSEPIVHKQPAVQSNPFAKQLAESVNAGTVTIESERAIAEAQGKLVIAKRFPRNQAVAYANIIDACRRPGLAEEACYSFPRGGEVVSGPAIRLAEMLAANWGNVDYGLRELSRKDGVSEMEAYAWDLETNVMSSQKFTVRHIRDTRGGGKALTDERDIYELTANMGARRLRARILAILPADLVQAAVDQCGKTLASGGDLPMADRIRSMVLAFKTLGVPASLIEKRLGHTLDSLTGEELADLRKIHNSLRDGMSKLTDWFGDKPADEDVPYEEAPPVEEKKRATPPPRSRKGAATVAENAPAATTEAAPAEATAPEPQKEAPKAEPAKTEPPKQAEAPKEPEAPKASEPKAPTRHDPLKDGEKIEVVGVVQKAATLWGRENGVQVPAVSAEILYDGKIRSVGHFGGATVSNPEMKDGAPVLGTGTLTAKPEWTVGNTIRITAVGKKNLSGAVPVLVKSISTEAASETLEG